MRTSWVWSRVAVVVMVVDVVTVIVMVVVIVVVVVVLTLCNHFLLKFKINSLYSIK